VVGEHAHRSRTGVARRVRSEGEVMKAGAPETQPDSVVLGLVGARTAEHRKHSADQQKRTD